jgi:hypothetical protein
VGCGLGPCTQIANSYEPTTTIELNSLIFYNVFLLIFQLMQKEAARSKRGKVSHSLWRNYDDLNEYFW